MQFGTTLKKAGWFSNPPSEIKPCRLISVIGQAVIHRRLSRIIIHEKFSLASDADDIALIKMDRPIRLRAAPDSELSVAQAVRVEQWTMEN